MKIKRYRIEPDYCDGQFRVIDIGKRCADPIIWLKVDGEDVCIYQDGEVQSPQAGREAGSECMELLSAFKTYTAKEENPYLRLAFFNDNSWEILGTSDDVLAKGDDIEGLFKLLATGEMCVKDLTEATERRPLSS